MAEAGMRILARTRARSRRGNKLLTLSRRLSASATVCGLRDLAKMRERKIRRIGQRRVVTWSEWHRRQRAGDAPAASCNEASRAPRAPRRWPVWAVRCRCRDCAMRWPRRLRPRDAAGTRSRRGATSSAVGRRFSSRTDTAAAAVVCPPLRASEIGRAIGRVCAGRLGERSEVLTSARRRRRRPCSLRVDSASASGPATPSLFVIAAKQAADLDASVFARQAPRTYGTRAEPSNGRTSRCRRRRGPRSCLGFRSRRGRRVELSGLACGPMRPRRGCGDARLRGRRARRDARRGREAGLAGVARRALRRRARLPGRSG